MTPKEALLRRVMEHIEAHPDEHVQNEWAIQLDCGTAYCFAGWAVVLSGDEIDWQQDMSARFCFTSDGKRWTIEDRAIELLGLDRAQAEELFDPWAEIEQLRRIVDSYIAGEVAP